MHGMNNKNTSTYSIPELVSHYRSHPIPRPRNTTMYPIRSPVNDYGLSSWMLTTLDEPGFLAPTPGTPCYGGVGGINSR